MYKAQTETEWHDEMARIAEGSYAHLPFVVIDCSSKLQEYVDKILAEKYSEELIEEYPMFDEFILLIKNDFDANVDAILFAQWIADNHRDLINSGDVMIPIKPRLGEFRFCGIFSRKNEITGDEYDDIVPVTTTTTHKRAIPSKVLGNDRFDVTDELIRAIANVAYIDALKSLYPFEAQISQPTITTKQRVTKAAPYLKPYKKVIMLAPNKKHDNADKEGTHASPRAHRRRGHMRQMRSGKKTWVRPTFVGDKEQVICGVTYRLVQ